MAWKNGIFWNTLKKTEFALKKKRKQMALLVFTCINKRKTDGPTCVYVY